MNAPPRKGFVAWLKELEARGDAWAAKRLTADEYAEAVKLDEKLKRHLWRYVAVYFVMAALLTLALVLVKQSSDWLRTFVLANFLLVSAIVFVISAWYGYSKWTGPKARRSFSVFLLLMMAGAATGTIVAYLEKGRSILTIPPEKLGTLAGAVLLMAFVGFAMLAGIANLRSREIASRMALLKGDAEREKLARQGVQAELKLLQAQVEPHFLFNTLANVRYLVASGSPDAIAMLDHLIHYLRTALPEIRSESSTLGRETELARAYLEIMRIRMGGSLAVDIAIPEDLAAEPFPPLMLMTLVENAIKHGVAPKGQGRVMLSAAREGGDLRITVADDGRGLVEPIGQGVGLGNIRERLRALHGDRGRLDLAGGEDAGTVATIVVPVS